MATAVVPALTDADRERIDGLRAAVVAMGQQVTQAFRETAVAYEASLHNAIGKANTAYLDAMGDIRTRSFDQLLALLEALMPQASWLNDEETLTYLHDCISDRPHRVALPSVPFHIDTLLTDAPVLGGLAPKLGTKHLKIISIRSYVTETEPGLLDGLNRLPISYRWVMRFLPLDREEGRKQLEVIRKRAPTGRSVRMIGEFSESS